MIRQNHLTESADFEKTRRQGRSVSHPLAVVYARRSGLDLSRVGVSVSKRVGNAVVRNRVRRRVFEYCRVGREPLPAGWDLLVIARGPAASAAYADLGQVVDLAVKRLCARPGSIESAGRVSVASGNAGRASGSGVGR